MQLKDNKRYVTYNLYEHPEIFAIPQYEDYEVPSPILDRLAKDIGVSMEMYHTVHSISFESANSIIRSMCLKNGCKEIAFLLDEDEKKVLGYTFDTTRYPILNTDFINRSSSLVEAYDSIGISDLYYLPDDTVSSMILRKKEPITILEKFEGKDDHPVEYEIGILLLNDELNSCSTRLVVYLEGQPIYLPPSYYNSTSARYKRSTGSSSEALEVLLLKVIDDLRENNLYEKIYEMHFRYRANKHITASYEEYNTLLRIMRKIPTIIEDNSFLESLLSRYDNFEKKYSHVEEQKSSYIWRCTAMSDITIGSLLAITSRILFEIAAPSMEYFNIRDLLGSYISTHRIADEIAKEDID